MDTELKEVANSWWTQQAEGFPGGKIPDDRAVALATEFGQLMDVDQQTAMQCAKDSGVLGGTTTKPIIKEQPPAPKPETKTGEQMPKQLERGAISRLVEEILPSHTNGGAIDFDAIHTEIKKLAGKDYPKGRVYPAVYTAQKNLAKKGSGQPKKAGTVRTHPAAPAPQETSAARGPEPSTATSRATSIDKKIAEIKAQIANLQKDLASLERAKEIMES